jgi:hypothetical protein
MVRTRIALTLLLIAAATTLSLARTDIKVHKETNFDFTKLGTFAWSDSPGEVKIIVSIDSNSKAEPVKRQYEPVLMQTVEEEMVKRGYTRAAAGTAPDFRLTYYVLITTGTGSQQMGQFLPANANWGIPLYTPSTSAFEVYTQGTIVLDVTAPPTGGKVVWRGVAGAKVDPMKTDDERAKRVRTTMKDLVAKYPKRGAK